MSFTRDAEINLTGMYTGWHNIGSRCDFGALNVWSSQLWVHHGRCFSRALGKRASDERAGRRVIGYDLRPITGKIPLKQLTETLQMYIFRIGI